MPRSFGEVASNPIGTVYVDRRALASAHVHRPLQHGISGAAAEGAESSSSSVVVTKMMKTTERSSSTQARGDGTLRPAAR